MEETVKMKKKLLSIVLCTVMILSSFAYIPVFAEETAAVRYTDTDPYWISPADKAPLEDYAYSIAVVGDTQIVSRYQPQHLETLVGWLLDNKDEKNIQFVSFLGDISDSWDEDDRNGNGIWDSYEELEASRKEFYKLNGKIPYNIVRGNHDSTNEFNKYFNDSGYKDQVEGFYDIGCVKNSYSRITVGDQKLLFITLDCDVHDGALDWAGKLCEQYSDHKVIVSTHVYLTTAGTHHTKYANSETTVVANGKRNTGAEIWDKFVRKYENISIVLSGHIPAEYPVCQQIIGDHGNVVNEFLIDPQGLDASFKNNGNVTGMVTMLYFSEDGKTMQVEQYSTVYDKFYRAEGQYKLDLENAYVAKDEFFYNYDFDGVPVGTQQEYIYSNAVSRLSNPYGFTLDTDAKLNGTVVEHSDGIGNYLKLNYSGVNTDQLTGARFRLVDKNGHSYTVAQSVSFEFDLRWQGVSDTSLIDDEQIMDLLQFRRAGNALSLLKATVVADGDVADQKLRIYTPEGNDVVTLDKDDDSFTKFKVVYYDVTQTYSVWVGNQIVAEARAATGTNIRRYEYVTTLYDADFMAVSREEVSTSDGINFVFGAVAYSETKHTPYVIDIDNLSVKKYENGDGRTVYYENSFDGTNSPFVSKDYSAGSSYKFGTTGMSVKAESESNSYLNSTSNAYFKLMDSYNLLQDGDWTLEFDVRATRGGSSNDWTNGILRYWTNMNVGSNSGNNIPLFVDGSGNIKYGMGPKVGSMQAPNVKMESASSNEWTHIALSMNIYEETNKNKIDWLSKGISNQLQYSLSLWVDGVYAGSYTGTNREEHANFSSNKANFINYKQYSRAALTACPDLTAFTLLNTTIDSTTSVKEEIYRDDATGSFYRIEYGADGNFVAGVLDTTNQTATGSISLKVASDTTSSEMDYLQFFNSKTLTGAIDNIKLYKGVIPESAEKQRADAVANDDVVRSIDFTEISLYNKINGYGTAGKEGVTFLNSWKSTFVRDTANDILTVTGTGTQTVLDVFTPDIAGKTFSIKLKAKNFVWTEGSTSTSGGLLTIRRQKAPETSAVFATLLSYDENGVYFTKGAGKYYLCDKNGNNIKIDNSKAWELEAIVDESRQNSAVSFLVDGNPAYFKAPGFGYDGYYFKAINIEGIIDTVKGLAGAADQRVRVLDMSDKALYSVGLISLEVKYVENPYAIWADDVMIDFSDYTSLEELGDQFYYTDGVKLENGELIIPEGESFAWLDYNDQLYNFKGGYTSGYNIEIKAKGEVSEDYVISVDQGSLGNVGLVTPAAAGLNLLDSDRYSNLSTTFANSRSGATVFNDSNYRGFWNFSNTSVLGSNDFMAIRFASGLKIAELYIHNHLDRELYKESGDIINIDADNCADVTYVNGIIGNQNNVFTKEKYVAPVKDEITGEITAPGYFRWDCTSTALGDRRADFSLNDYIFNKVTVFEWDFALTYPEGATGANMEFLSFRRVFGKDGTSASAQWEKLLYIKDNGQISTSIHGILYNKDGTLLQLADGARSKVAVIYDGVHKKVSYRVNGYIPYVKSGEELISADNLALTSSHYAWRSVDTRLITFNLGDGFKGIFDLYGFNIYNVDSDLTANLVGVQVDISDNNIRLVGGVDMLYYGSAGYELEVQDANGNLLSSAEKSLSNNVVYSSIKAASDTLYPNDFGWRYFFTANIEKVDTTKPVKLLIKPYTAVNGIKSYGEKLALNIDFTSPNVNNWTYEFEKIVESASSAE